MRIDSVGGDGGCDIFRAQVKNRTYAIINIYGLQTYYK